VTPEEAVEILKVGEEYLALNPNNEQFKKIVKQSERIALPLIRQRILALRPIRNSIGVELKLLPAGTFKMGQHNAISKRDIFDDSGISQ
jgi:hypothetical protein